jgi:acyl-CoA thioesterase II
MRWARRTARRRRRSISWPIACAISAALAPAAAAARTRLYVASLNHAIWLHRPLRADEWLLFDCLSPSGAVGRGLSIARIYNTSGDLVASATRECLLAPVD